MTPGATREIAFHGELMAARGGGHVIRVEEVLASTLGARHLSRVAGTLNGRPFRSNLAKMGGRMFLGVHKANVDALGLNFGDTVAVVVNLDAEPLDNDVPTVILVEALRQDPVAAAAWDKLAPSRRREVVGSIRGAKKEETRARRVKRTIDELAGRNTNA
ncbi:MAG: YdeI/OmpD-associated family protein [Actinomycetota bacterium]